MLIAAFAPCTNATGLVNTLNITVGVAAATVLLPVGTGTIGRAGMNQLRLQNQGTVTVYVNIGTASVAAATVANSYPILAGMTEIITIDPSATSISTISGSAAQNLAVTLGEGI